MTAFVDTSFHIARIMPRDRRHEKALRAVRPGITFFTSAFVIDETISLLQARGFFPPQSAFCARPGSARTFRSSTRMRRCNPTGGTFARWGTGRGERRRLRQLRRNAQAVDPEGVYF
jgi:hypothetical protein